MSEAQGFMLCVSILLAPHLSERHAKIVCWALFTMAVLQSEIVRAFLRGLFG